ncbi:arginase family protein [Yersinia ruckeri]|uniref:arginase family protein n=1 Tax=Yersinia ruckeri TaxID=29486 RepID=UPI002238FE65|nr:arginase family protein [Yersinia ruckeri]MCW6598833.1 arginase family protein [Yersinia ruckeri]
MAFLDTPIASSAKFKTEGDFGSPVVNIIGAACGLNCGPDSDTYHAAAYLQDLFDILRVNPKFRQPPLELFKKARFSSIVDEKLHAEVTDDYKRTGMFSRDLADVVKSTMKMDMFPLVVGGDHSCAIGTWRGVSEHAKGSIGLIWIDAHMDSHTDKTSHTGAIHGMPLASLMGHGHSELVDCWNFNQAVDPQYSTMIGIRSYEPEEQEFLERMGIKIVYANPHDKVDYVRAFEEAVVRAMACPNGYGITFDLDVLDPLDMPQVACYVPDGLAWVEVEAMIESLTVEQKDKLLAFEVVEFAPNIANFFDREQKMTPDDKPHSAYDSGTRVFNLIGNLIK